MIVPKQSWQIEVSSDSGFFSITGELSCRDNCPPDMDREVEQATEIIKKGLARLLETVKPMPNHGNIEHPEMRRFEIHVSNVSPSGNAWFDGHLTCPAHIQVHNVTRGLFHMAVLNTVADVKWSREL